MASLHTKVDGRKEMFYLTTHSTHFIYSYMASVHTKADVLGDGAQQVDDVEMLANVNENHQL